MMLALIDWHAFFFMVFAAIACVFALGVLFSANVVRMAFYLVISLGATAGLFILAGEEFVGAMQLMIYVGGTLVLLIFGVMLTAQQRFISMKTASGEWVLAVIVGSMLLLLLLRVAVAVPGWRQAHYATQLAFAAKQLGAEVELQNRLVARLAKLAGEANPSRNRMRSLGERQGELAERQAGVAEQLEVIAARMQGEVPEAAEEIDAIAESLKAAGEVELAEMDSALAKSRAEEIKLTLEGAIAEIDAVVDRVGPQPSDAQRTTRLGLALTGVRLDRGAGYLLPFVIVSVHLLVVLVGAAYLARTKRRASRSLGQGSS